MSKVVLGIDPGLASLGFGIVQSDSSGQMQALEYGCITTKSRQDLDTRLKEIYDQICELIDRYKPHSVAVEEVFFSRNVKSALLVSKVCGVVMIAARNRGVTAKLYTPLQIKQTAACYGRASKMQVQKMIGVMLNLERQPQSDHAADALGAAVCHIHTQGY